MSSDKERKTYSIADLANEFDITHRTIRFYEEQGMITPSREGRDRVYTDKDRVALILILRGKRIGFSLAECKGLIDLYNPQGNQHQLNIMLEKIAERRLQLEQQLLDIEQMQLELDSAEERCRVALQDLEASQQA
ncbi:MAG TPA: MerR family DNA-binding transcriptional regulator [Alcanivoracaceae bacterium]|nr:MerR family DNA-binding transcriptional regulator [Alcanivoracaceae bacterium]